MANAGHHPTIATFPPGRPDFGYSTPKRYPIILPHYPKMAGLFDHIDPTAHHAPSEFHPSSSLCYRRRRTRTICVMSYGSPGHKPPRPLSLSPTKSRTSARRSLSPSNQKPPQHSSSIYRQIMSDATTLLSQKCYPDTKSLREAVAQIRHHLRTSYFWLGWNYFVRQGVSYTIFSTKEAMFLFSSENRA